jgi:hypothetical protein
MGKQLKNRSLFAGRISRALLAVSLSASLATAGCTTNRNPGNGEPLRDGFVHTAPTGGVTGGSEIPTMPPPMTSSYSRPEVASNRTAYVGPDAAAAIMGEHQSVRVLGVVNPGLSGSTYISDGLVTGQFRNPALITNPQVTVNSSISSQPTPVVTDGANGVSGSGMIIGSVTADGTIIGTTANTTLAGTTANATVAGATASNSGLALGGNVNSAAPVILSSNGTVAPTSVVAPTLTPGAFAGGSTATVTTSSLGASPTLASAGTTNVSTIAGTTPATTTATTGTTTTGATTATAPATTSGTTAASTVTGMTSSGVTAGATVARRAIIATGVSSASPLTTTGTTSNATATTTARSGAVRVVRTGGRVVVTNVSGSNQ